MRVREGRPLMGTVLDVTLEAPTRRAGRAAAEELFALGDELEAIFTTWDPDSATRRLGAQAGGPPQAVPPPLLHLLRESLRLTELTGGAFDVTVGPLVALWRQAAQVGRLPTGEELAAAHAKLGASRVRIEADGRVALAPGTALDFGGVAKGWALDRMGERLAARGIERALLNFGQSSMLALGAPTGEDGWRLLIEGGEGGESGVVVLRNRSLSVSRSFGRWSEIEGERVGHVFDPRTGRPVAHEALAVVMAARGDLAEALSTALLVLEPAAGHALLERLPGVEGMIASEGGVSHRTPGFRMQPLAPGRGG